MCAHAHQASKNQLRRQKTTASIHAMYRCGGFLSSECASASLVCVCMCTRTYTYAYTHTHTRALYLKSISILFPSSPIHELRLDLNVANTVIALTIRVIYLSLIITLKRGVVVLWFTVTCPLSSGFLPTIIPAEQFLSPKLNCAFTHTHQARARIKTQPEQDTSILYWKS